MPCGAPRELMPPPPVKVEHGVPLDSQLMQVVLHSQRVRSKVFYPGPGINLLINLAFYIFCPSPVTVSC